ncbi:hypothetical protein PINS_up015664 [Pythium insidiosum]|nr:hypothetical protein PINS_up015664 [Pythium insidiosum]
MEHESAEREHACDTAGGDVAPDDEQTQTTTASASSRLLLHAASVVLAEGDGDQCASTNDNDAGITEEMKELVADVKKIASVLASVDLMAHEVDHDIRQSVRAWPNRAKVKSTGGDDDDSEPYVIPIKAPTSTWTAPPEDTKETRAVVFDDGVYRGHVRRIVMPLPVEMGENETSVKEPERFVPHGWGIVTSANGLRRIGWWEDGVQVNMGSLQSAVFQYDGEWIESNPSGRWKSKTWMLTAASSFDNIRLPSGPMNSHIEGCFSWVPFLRKEDCGRTG